MENKTLKEKLLEASSKKEAAVTETVTNTVKGVKETVSWATGAVKSKVDETKGKVHETVSGATGAVKSKVDTVSDEVDFSKVQEDLVHFVSDLSDVLKSSGVLDQLSSALNQVKSNKEEEDKEDKNILNTLVDGLKEHFEPRKKSSFDLSNLGNILTGLSLLSNVSGALSGSRKLDSSSALSQISNFLKNLSDNKKHSGLDLSHLIESLKDNHLKVDLSKDLESLKEAGEKLKDSLVEPIKKRFENVEISIKEFEDLKALKDMSMEDFLKKYSTLDKESEVKELYNEVKENIDEFLHELHNIQDPKEKIEFISETLNSLSSVFQHSGFSFKFLSDEESKQGTNILHVFFSLVETFAPFIADLIQLMGVDPGQPQRMTNVFFDIILRALDLFPIKELTEPFSNYIKSMLDLVNGKGVFHTIASLLAVTIGSLGYGAVMLAISIGLSFLPTVGPLINGAIKVFTGIFPVGKWINVVLWFVFNVIAVVLTIVFDEVLSVIKVKK
jgi:hypothetical protein